VLPQGRALVELVELVAQATAVVAASVVVLHPQTLVRVAVVLHIRLRLEQAAQESSM
jgi:hypothetical protein